MNIWLGELHLYFEINAPGSRAAYVLKYKVTASQQWSSSVWTLYANSKSTHTPHKHSGGNISWNTGGLFAVFQFLKSVSRRTKGSWSEYSHASAIQIYTEIHIRVELRQFSASLRRQLQDSLESGQQSLTFSVDFSCSLFFFSLPIMFNVWSPALPSQEEKLVGRPLHVNKNSNLLLV